MKYEEIINVLAPCGLDCQKCILFEDGEIKKKSEKLQKLLEGFNKYAERFANMMPVFKEYPSFEKILNFFSTGDCQGCREGEGKNSPCNVRNCSQEKGIDFCFQCDEFPCNKHYLNQFVVKKWLEINKMMLDIGVENYYEQIKDKPRYKIE